MQANCPQCGQPVAIDDARAPDKPFGVKCPRCQTIVRFPGRVAADAAPTIPPPAPVPAPAASPVPPTAAADPAPAPRADAPAPGSRGRALVALPSRELSLGVAGLAGRQGYAVEIAEDWEEAARLLDLGAFALVATARAAGGPGKGESLYQRTNRLSPDARRQVFVVLVGEEFKSGDGTQAFTSLGDLVLNTRDAASADTLLRNTVLERQRVYQVYLDARRRLENSD